MNLFFAHAHVCTLSQAHPVVKSWLRHCNSLWITDVSRMLSFGVTSSPRQNTSTVQQKDSCFFWSALLLALSRSSTTTTVIREGSIIFLKALNWSARVPHPPVPSALALGQHRCSNQLLLAAPQSPLALKCDRFSEVSGAHRLCNNLAVYSTSALIPPPSLSLSVSQNSPLCTLGSQRQADTQSNWQNTKIVYQPIKKTWTLSLWTTLSISLYIFQQLKQKRMVKVVQI